MIAALAELRRHVLGLRHVGEGADAERAHAEGDTDLGTDTRIARYAVRLGPYPSRQTAATMRARLAQRGFRVVLAGRTLRIGSFTNVAKAEHVATQLRQSGYHPVLVLL